MSAPDTSAEAVERVAQLLDEVAEPLRWDCATRNEAAALLRALVAERDGAIEDAQRLFGEAELAERVGYARGFREGAEKMRDRSANIAATEGWQGAVGRMGSYDEGALDRADEIATAIRALPLPEPQA